MPFYLILASKSDHKLSIILDCHKGHVIICSENSFLWAKMTIRINKMKEELVKNFKILFKKTVTSLL